MEYKYFKLDDDFNRIIKNTLPYEEIKNIKFISTGWTNIVYEVETNKDTYFFRFPRDEFWSRTIVKDYEFAKYIHNKTDFNTIKLDLAYDNSRPFSIHRKIPGKPLAEIMNTLSKEEVKDISKDIAKFMYQLHTLEYDKNNIFSINDIGLDLNDFLDELLKKHVSNEDIKFWTPSKKNDKFCLVHGDLNSSNVLLDENNKVTAFIDFGFGGFGNKYDDIGRIIGRCPMEFKNEIVNAYEDLSKSSINKETLDNSITTWSNIDNGYINYMKKIGIYE